MVPTLDEIEKRLDALERKVGIKPSKDEELKKALAELKELQKRIEELTK